MLMVWKSPKYNPKKKKKKKKKRGWLKKIAFHWNCAKLAPPKQIKRVWKKKKKRFDFLVERRCEVDEYYARSLYLYASNFLNFFRTNSFILKFSNLFIRTTLYFQKIQHTLAENKKKTGMHFFAEHKGIRSRRTIEGLCLAKELLE